MPCVEILWFETANFGNFGCYRHVDRLWILYGQLTTELRRTVQQSESTVADSLRVVGDNEATRLTRGRDDSLRS